jgi:hypothetical protein
MLASTPATCAKRLLPICSTTNTMQIYHGCKKEHEDQACESAHSLSYQAGLMHRFLQPT